MPVIVVVPPPKPGEEDPLIALAVVVGFPLSLWVGFLVHSIVPVFAGVVLAVAGLMLLVDSHRARKKAREAQEILPPSTR